MATNSQKRKQQKQVARKKRLERERNIKHNTKKPKYHLEVHVADQWSKAKNFYTDAEVTAYTDLTESQRAKGDVEIIAGRIRDVRTGRITWEISPYQPETAQDAAKKAAKGVRGTKATSVVMDEMSESKKTKVKVKRSE